MYFSLFKIDKSKLTEPYISNIHSNSAYINFSNLMGQTNFISEFGILSLLGLT